MKEEINIIEILKKEQKIRELQEKYEKGLILEADLTENQKEELKKLYKSQINLLDKQEKEYKQEIEYYKNKIIKIRKKAN